VKDKNKPTDHQISQRDKQKKQKQIGLHNTTQHNTNTTTKSFLRKESGFLGFSRRRRRRD